MTYSQILFASSQERRRIAWGYFRMGKAAEFTRQWAMAKRLIRRAREQYEAEKQAQNGVAA